jgi:hypothetical protein
MSPVSSSNSITHRLLLLVYCALATPQRPWNNIFSSWCKHPITATKSKNKTLGRRTKSFSPRPPWHYFPVRFRQRPTQFQLNFNNNFFRTTPSISFTKQPCLPASTIVPGRPIQPLFRPHLRPLPPIHLLRIDRRSFWPLSVL